MTLQVWWVQTASLIDSPIGFNAPFTAVLKRDEVVTALETMYQEPNPWETSAMVKRLLDELKSVRTKPQPR